MEEECHINNKVIWHALRNSMTEKIKKNSNSHANLEIIKYFGYYVVVKSFHSDLGRVIKSIDKQVNFPNIRADGLTIESAPLIEKRFDIDSINIYMPYIDGICGADFALYGDRSTGENLSKTLIKLIDYELSNSTLVKVSRNTFIDKIDSIKIPRDLETLAELYHKARNLIENGQEFYDIPCGFCHGDLTLSNVIYRPGVGLVLIDFLETFIESPLQDIAKLKQDLMYGWSFRFCSESVKIKSKIFCGYINKRLEELIDDKYKNEIMVFSLMSLLRIFPYVKDQETIKWLEQSLDHLLQVQ